MGLKADRRASAGRSSMKLKADRRTSAGRSSMKLKSDRRTSKDRSSMKLKADRRTRAGRTSVKLKADRRTSAARAVMKSKVDTRTSAVRTSMKLKADRRTGASRTSPGLKADSRGASSPTTEMGDVGQVFELPSCAFGPNVVGGDCFFQCIATATGHSVHSQRVLLSLAVTDGDLDLYRCLREWSVADLAGAISANAAEDRVSDMSLRRAQIVADEMDFVSGVADLDGLRCAVLRSSYWADPIAVGRIQLALNVKVVALSNMGGGKYTVIHDELPPGVTHFAPDNYVVVRYDGSLYELMEDGSGKNLFHYDELPVEIRLRVARKGFFSAIRAAPDAEKHLAHQSTIPEISDSPLHRAPTGRPSIDDAVPPSDSHRQPRRGGSIAMNVEELNAMYLTDCTFEQNSAGGDCFFLRIEQSTGHSAYSQRALLSGAMTEADLELHHAILSNCEAELASAIGDQENGIPVSEIRMGRCRIVISEMEFCRDVSDVAGLREAALAKNYWADSIAIERIQLALNVKVVILRQIGGGLYDIQYDILPAGVANFAPDAFVVVRYDGSHYELLVDSDGKKSFQYDELPRPIKDRLVGKGFYSAIECVPKTRIIPPLHQTPPAQNLNCPTPKKKEASRIASIRERATNENPLRLAARRRRDHPNPDAHDAGKMETPCRFCGALRWRGEIQRTALCCISGKVKVEEIREPPEPLLSLLLGTHEDSKDFHANIREYNSLMSFASIGAQLDLDMARRPGSYVYRIHGSVYHRIGPLAGAEGEVPKYAQIYLFDTDAATDVRMSSSFSRLRRSTLSALRDMMARCNPFPPLFMDCAARMRQEGHEDARLILRTDDDGLDRRRYNAPRAPEVAAVISEESSGNPRDIKLALHGGGVSMISETHPCYDPLAYALIHPKGERGWCLGMPHSKGGRTITANQFASYRLMVRKESTNAIHLCGRLLHQYMCDQWAKVEQCRMRYFRYNQDTLRAASFRQVQNPHQGAEKGADVGKRIILPATYTGGPRQMRELYQDAMAVVRQFGKPHLFITFTCNPAWPEVRGAMLANQHASMRPDVTARVFRIKLDALMKDIYEAGVFGRTVARLYVIEFQKRGLPHAHILCIIADEDAPKTTEDYDSIVSAVIPDQDREPALWHTVTTSMMHGPCGAINPKSPCMDGGVCTKGYPKRFRGDTVEVEGFPEYRRPDDGRVVAKNGFLMTNQWVVPHNPWLCSKYDAHINVEVCSTVSAVKYLYKYVYKGPDRAALEIGNDEIKAYLDGRYFSAQEACWRLLDFEIHGKYPPVVRLHVHLRDEQIVHFQDEELIEDIAARPGRETTLTAWFVANTEHPEAARGVKYHDFPKFFVWLTTQRKWKPRARNQTSTVGRMYSADPVEGERFFLRLLLTEVTGCTSYDCLKTLPDGTVCETFREAAAARGLLYDDREHFLAFEEAASHATPRALSRLFATILAYCAPGSPRNMWDVFCQHLADGSSDDAIERATLQLNEDLRALGSSLAAFPSLPQLSDEQLKPKNTAHALEFATGPQKAYADTHIPLLNAEQKMAFRSIMSDVDSGDQGTHFIEGPGGVWEDFSVQRPSRGRTQQRASSRRRGVVRNRCVIARRRQNCTLEAQASNSSNEGVHLFRCKRERIIDLHGKPLAYYLGRSPDGSPTPRRMP